MYSTWTLPRQEWKKLQGKWESSLAIAKWRHSFREKVKVYSTWVNMRPADEHVSSGKVLCMDNMQTQERE